MPDFSVEFTGPMSLTLPAWNDPAVVDAPSRLNPNPAYPHRYVRVPPPASVVMKAVVGGVQGPADGALGGRLFQVSWVQWSGPYPPSLLQTVGSSSIATVALDAVHLGFFAVLFWREAGGGIVVPFNAEA